MKNQTKTHKNSNNDISYNYDFEKINYGNFKKIAGFDEAGRGALAGPIVVAAVILPKEFYSVLIKDSKKLSRQARELAYDLIIKTAIDFSIIVINLEYIELNNPKRASIHGLEEAFKKLTIKPEICLVDYEKPKFSNFNGTTESLIKGDQKALCIAAASILAKVTRDKIMIDYHQEFPDYMFNLHKGYYTKIHQAAVNKFGVCSIHRKTYLPIKNLLTVKK